MVQNRWIQHVVSSVVFDSTFMHVYYNSAEFYLIQHAVEEMWCLNCSVILIFPWFFVPAEQFMFRRSNSRDPNLSAYMADKFDSVEEEESEEELLASSQDYRRPQLDPESEGEWGVGIRYKVQYKCSKNI